ncbi:glycoside hydrolase family 3 C-terminal domain-containing protein [Microbacterium sp. R86528]|uniref:glycoside hydrolase family 3 C-terminal domain-containing protein n=1 Tax=Microbacterium sp. R86528 TaxID=3093864 RepID=UPI0037C7C31E
MTDALMALFNTIEKRSAQPPAMPDGAAWADTSRSTQARVDALLQELTAEEKSDLLYGRGLKVSPEGAFWQAWIKGNDRVGIPDVTQGDSPAAVLVGPPNVTQIPSEHSLGASFAPDSARTAARALAAQTHRLGYGVWHAPTLDVARDYRHGRVHENFGEDVHLVSIIGEAYARGIQDEKVVADLKHVGMNAVETDRLSTNYVVNDDRVIGHYLAPFRSVIQNMPIAMIMTAYAKINGSHVNDVPAYFDLLREEWGFNGVARNDAMAAHSLESLELGLDQEFRDEEFFGSVLLEAIEEGRIDPSVLDAAVGRILSMMIDVGLFDNPPVPVQWQGPLEGEMRAAHDSATRGVVLLENRDKLLPLSPVSSPRITVCGPAAVDAAIAGGPTRAIADRDTFLDALREKLPAAQIDYIAGIDAIALTDMLPGFDQVSQSALSAGVGVGVGLTATFYDEAGEVLATRDATNLSIQTTDWAFGGDPDVAPPAGTARVTWTGSWLAAEGDHEWDVVTGGDVTISIDGEEVLSHRGGSRRTARTTAQIAVTAGAHRILAEYVAPDETQRAFVDASSSPLKVGLRAPKGAIAPSLQTAVDRASAADIAIVVVRDLASEGSDRSTLRLPGQQEALIRAVSAANPRTIVVLETASAVLTPWRDSVGALVQGWYGGSRGNAAIVDVLAGLAEPAGRLPVSFPERDEDLPTFASERFPGVDKVVTVDEAETGYRYFGHNGAPVAAYPFGFGLSYTTFAFGALNAPASTEVPAAAALRATRTGSIPVSVSVTNSGERDGFVVPQLYVRAPGAAIAHLKSFASVAVSAGQQSEVDLSVAWADLAVYQGGEWSIPAGTYELALATSASDTVETIEVEVTVS